MKPLAISGSPKFHNLTNLTKSNRIIFNASFRHCPYVCVSLNTDSEVNVSATGRTIQLLEV